MTTTDGQRSWPGGISCCDSDRKESTTANNTSPCSMWDSDWVSSQSLLLRFNSQHCPLQRQWGARTEHFLPRCKRSNLTAAPVTKREAKETNHQSCCSQFGVACVVRGEALHTYSIPPAPSHHMLLLSVITEGELLFPFFVPWVEGAKILQLRRPRNFHTYKH